MVHLMVAPAGHGKTAYAIGVVRTLPPLSPVRVLVPDQIQAAAFRRRMAEEGGALGVRVQTFYGLYAEVLALAGGTLGMPQPEPEQGMARPTARLMPAVRQRLILHVAETLYGAGHLPTYEPVRHSPGFARLLGDLFGELKRARVFPEDLERVLAGGEPRLAELGHLYAAYQDWLIETGWVDADGQGWLAAIALERDPSLLSDLSLLVVDGFDEFNPTQLHLLGLLAGRADSTLVTLIGDPKRPDRLAQRRLARARAALESTFDVEPVTLPGESRAGPLAHLEAHLFEPGAASITTDGAVTFVEAQNRAAEAREALRWLKARLVRDGTSIADVALIARDVTPYRLFLQEVADEFGLPLRFSSGAPLPANPAVAALLNLLIMPLDPDPWSPRAVIDALTSPYLDWTACGLEAGDADLLYDVAQAGQVIAGLDQWREAFRRLVGRKDDRDEGLERDDGEGVSSRRLLDREEVARLAGVLEAISAWIEPPSQATLRQRVTWLEALIGDDPAQARRGPDTAGDDGTSLRVVVRARANRATAERDVAALCAVKDILRAQVLADAVLVGGEDAFLSPNSFVATLVQAVQETTFTVPVEGEAILIASALEARGLTFDSVALLGLSEGDFPSAEREDPLLREADRTWLSDRDIAIEHRLQSDEATLFYQAVTRARRRLLICRPYLADDGQPWEASPYWSAALGLFDGAQVDHIRPADPVHSVASKQELVDVMPGDEVRDTAAVLLARSHGDASPQNGDLSAVAERLGERFGPHQPWSSSRLETYAKCPLYFWTAHVMALEPRELPLIGFDVLVLGSIYHAILEQLYNQVPDGDPDQLRARLGDIAQPVLDASPGVYGFRPTPMWERQREEMTEVLRHTVEALIETSGGYEPLTRELPFGLKGKRPLALGGDPSVLLRGYIDRVDRAPDGRLRIIDYKAGSTSISARDLAHGHRLQLPLYALAAQEALGTEVASGFYWHIGPAKASSLKLEKFASVEQGRRGVTGAIETAVEYARSICAAVCEGRFAPAPTGDECPRFCPAAAFCEWYKPRVW